MSRRLAPEWGPTEKIWLAWPPGVGDWAPLLMDIRAAYVAMIQAILPWAEVWLVHDPADAGSVPTLDGLTTLPVPINDTWIRDYGPIPFFQKGDRYYLDYTFNGWGGKYAADQDTQVNQRLATRKLLTNLESYPLVLEGGAFETNGAGTLLATTQCIIDPARNPGLTQAQIEAQLKSQMGIRQFLWIEAVCLAGDDTDGHIDTMARFCDTHRIIYVREEDPTDTNYLPLQSLEDQLRRLRQADGQPYQLIPLPMPSACFSPSGGRLPATYANFLIVNGAVLVPVYSVAEDAAALEVIRQAFPCHKVIGVDSQWLIRQGGSLHCATR